MRTSRSTQGFHGKRVLVTGASRGIGLAIARRFRDAGASVVGVARDATPLREHPGIEAFSADATDPQAMAQAVQLAADGDELDICVANAGAAAVESFLDADPAQWETVLRANLISAMVTFQAAARRMLPDESGGRLIATASAAGLRGEAWNASYSASKGGIVTLVQALAVELAPRGITVNAVAPGEVDTALQREGMEALARLHGRESTELANEIGIRTPLGRIGGPEDATALFVFLASDAAGFITGATIPVDGGWLLV